MLGCALLLVALPSICSANMVFLDGFTIELPVRFEMKAQLKEPMLVPFKVTGQTDSPAGPPTRPSYPSPLQTLFDNPPSYSSVVKQRPYLPPHPSAFYPYHSRSTTLYPPRAPTTTQPSVAPIAPLEAEGVVEEKEDETVEGLSGEFSEEAEASPKQR